MITPELITRGGSKLEVTRSLLESNLNIPIPNSAWKYYDEEVGVLRDHFIKMKKPVIVRGSHVNDWDGFIDVVETIDDLSNFSDVIRAVESIERCIDNDKVRLHCEDWGQKFTPKVHVLMQEQGSNIRGSMIRHPNNKEKFIIQYREESGFYHDNVNYAEVNLGNIQSMHDYGVNDEHMEQVVQMYLQIENSGLVDPSWAYQMEFGLKPLLFYQFRPFKKKQLAPEFTEPNVKGNYPFITSDTFFGAEDTDVDFKFVSIQELMYPKSDFKSEKEYGLYLYNGFGYNDSPALDLKIGNLKVFCPSSFFFNYLFHSNYRLMKRADITLIQPEVYPSMSFDEMRKTFRYSRIFISEDRARIIPRKYLK